MYYKIARKDQEIKYQDESLLFPHYYIQFEFCTSVATTSKEVFLFYFIRVRDESGGGAF